MGDPVTSWREMSTIPLFSTASTRSLNCVGSESRNFFSTHCAKNRARQSKVKLVLDYVGKYVLRKLPRRTKYNFLMYKVSLARYIGT